MKELNISATIENIPAVTEFVDAELEACGCPMKAQMQIDIAIDELFGNIARYAYNPDVGPATVRVEVTDSPLAVEITFIDGGIPYDPLKKEDPDITLSAEQREIGGLGIFMVKKSMDSITYEYKDGKNILAIKKIYEKRANTLKNKLFKLLAVILCFTLALSLFGCGNKDEEKNNSEGNGAANVAPENGENADSNEQESEPEGETEPETKDPAVVTVYSTNDIHGVVAEIPDNGVIGLMQIAGIAASTENSLLIDAGDATQGQSFATVDTGKHVIDVMNAAGYDAMAAGIHEFDYGAEALLANAEAADFPILSANTLKDGEPLLDCHTVIEVGGYNIGIVGLTTVSTATSTNPAKLEGVTFEDELETAKSEIAELTDSVDAIILVTHLGDNPLAANITSQDLLEGLSEDELAKVAAVIDGHSHTVENSDVNGIPIVQTGTQNTAMGVVTVSFDGTGSFSATGEVWDYEKASTFELSEDGEAAKAAAQAAYDNCIIEIDPILAEEVALTGAPIWGGYIYYDYAEPRIVETTMGDLVTDAFKYYGEMFAENTGLSIPVIGVENGGGIGAALPYGIVTRGDILNAFNHGNTVEVIKVTPAQLYTALELGLTMTAQDDDGRLVTEKASGSFLQVSGISYEYDPGGEAGAKVVSVALDDGSTPARDDDSTELMIVTNNYVTTFDGFNGGTKLGEIGGEDQIIMDYILHLTNDGADTLTIDNVAGRINIANDKSPETYDVVIPIKTADGSEYDFSGKEFEISVDNGTPEKVSCEADGIHMTVTKGAHTFYLTESSDAVPVYTNNYSGSGTVTTADGYYHLYFTVDPATLG